MSINMDIEWIMDKEWVKKMRYIYNAILFSHKKNKIGSFLRCIWTESVIQSKVNQKKEQSKHHVLTHISGI